MIDELHLTMFIPNDLPDVQADSIRLKLASNDFMTKLRQTVRMVLREFPELTVVRVSLTR